MRIYGTDIDDNTLKETSPDVTDAFPFRTDCTDLQDYPGKMFPWHWHNDVEILMIVSDKIEFRTSGNSYTLNSGDIIFITSNVLHCTNAVADLPGIHKEFVFSPILIGGAVGSSIAQKYVVPLVNSGPEIILIPANHPRNSAISKCLNEAYDLYISKPDGYELYIRHSMEEVWMQLRDEADKASLRKPKHTASEERIHAILNYLQDNYGFDITVADMADIAGVSTRECSRCFKTQLGTTPMVYLLNLRISKACEMLQSTDHAIGHIAMSCGFSSASYFTKLFREKMGMTPREYKVSL